METFMILSFDIYCLSPCIVCVHTDRRKNTKDLKLRVLYVLDIKNYKSTLACLSTQNSQYFIKSRVKLEARF